HIDFPSIGEALSTARRAGQRSRALIVVNPNNPTGSFIKRDELARLVALCGEANLAVISDEVFAPYPSATDPTRVSTLAIEPLFQAAGPAFSLGGLSKASGLPQLKLGWIVVGGRGPSHSVAALELIADTYLSVATPVQAAAGDLLALGAEVRAAIATRVAKNRAALAEALPPTSACTLLPAEGGWSAILRLPASRSDEAWATALIVEDRVLTHPGYFFDLRGGTFLVVSLLPRPEVFGEAIARLVARVDATLR
ncbi:MAG TPA: pyridoxal phosphate-dependent aminotransferase, partial [Polyangia bacterium]